MSDLVVDSIVFAQSLARARVLSISARKRRSKSF
jgi:hypothetical protein